MEYDCRFRLPKKCTHPKVVNAITFDLIKSEPCGDCSYKESPTKNQIDDGHILQQHRSKQRKIG